MPGAPIEPWMSPKVEPLTWTLPAIAATSAPLRLES